ncbi:expressed unknown protein [Seminavis robusta]|uniref:Uncharacterized protein n=1 Tax=Seminavis robusta TaxID=568900 RepID=A0A9N8EGH3_9STRA|nr:expressed unknown protein [Seminavis robusta]|eukprot:Sro901_g218090.1 n/a (1192) ;mRNA; r:38278-41853
MADDGGTPNNNNVKKKKTKRGSTRNKEGMSSSGRVSSSRRGRDSTTEGVEEQRQRSQSNDKKPRRDSRRSSGIGMGASGKHHDGANKSPARIRKSKASADPGTAAPQQHHSSRGERTQPNKNERSRSRSPTRSPSKTEKGGAPRLPHRTVSGCSELQATLDAARNKPKDNFEEASLGDFQKYSQQQKDKRSTGLAGSTLSKNMIPEASLGSFTAFHKNYQQEALLGLHDDDEDPVAPYGGKNKKQTPPQLLQQQTQQQQHEQSASLGNLMNPMKQYGGGAVKPSTAGVEASLGSFTAFHKNYEQEQLLGLHNSNMSAAIPPPSQAATAKESGSVIPEESMGDFVQAASKEKALSQKTETPDRHGRSSKPKKGERDSDAKEKEFDPATMPSSRIKYLGKRGGVGYKIMVDTPGGHSPEPMKIVVAIEYEDDDDDGESDDSDDSEHDDENENPVETSAAESVTSWHRQSSKKPGQDSKLMDSGQVPIAPTIQDSTATKDKAPTHHRKKRHPRKTSEDGTKQKPTKEDEEEENHSEEDDDDDDQVAPLAASLSRWSNPPSSGGPALNQPEREKSGHSRSTSTNSTMSSVTLESVLERGAVAIQSDACPSNANALQRQPAGKPRVRRASGAGSLRRPSVAPHNLGTKRGLLLRQQSEASMMSTGTTKSNDSSWQGNNDMPEDYQASFMQLNLMDLEKTQIQTNESVQQTQLPDELKSGVELIGRSNHNQQGDSPKMELESIPEGRDPTVAASELLGMKTMLKHIKRVAPKRSRSFEFDRNMPKEMWNKMFAKSQKGALPGSQYVDDDDSIELEEEEEKVESTKNEEADTAAQQKDDKGVGGETGDGTSTSVTAGLFNTIKRVTSLGPTVQYGPSDKEKTAPAKEKSIWSSAMKKVLPTMNSTEDEIDPSQLENDKDAIDVSEKSLELEGILQELDQSLAINDVDLAPEPPTLTPPAHRRRSEDRGDGSARGPRTGTHLGNEAPKKGGTARTRAARAQQVHNRSLRDTLDFLSAEQDDDELPQLDAIKEEDPKQRKPRVRARRKPPNRTKSDDSGMGRAAPSRAKSSDASGRGLMARTRSNESSPGRPVRESVKKLHSSFSGVDPSDLPGRSREKKEAPPRTKSRDGPGHHHKDNSVRTGRADKGLRGSAGRKQRPVRKKSTEEPQEKAESSGHYRGVRIPKNATENEVRELLDYH